MVLFEKGTKNIFCLEKSLHRIDSHKNKLFSNGNTLMCCSKAKISSPPNRLFHGKTGVTRLAGLLRI